MKIFLVLLMCTLAAAQRERDPDRISSLNVDCATYAPNCTAMCPSVCVNKTEKLYIQGFVPALNDAFRSENIVAAAFAAVDEVNADCDLIPGYELVLEFVNTECDPSEATWQLINSIVLQDQARNVTKIMFFGGGCSLATEPLAALAGRFYEIPMLSYGASSPALSNSEMFPRFFRTLPSETQANLARIAVMMKYGWSRVATLHETEAIFTSSANNFHEKYNDAFLGNSEDNSTEGGNRDLILRSFTDDPMIPLTQIKEEDIRIIAGYYYEDKAADTLCEALKQMLHTPQHVWMYIAWYERDWWMDPRNRTKGECDINMLRSAVRYALFFDSYNRATEDDDPPKTASRSYEEFKTKFDCYLEEFLNNNQTAKLVSNPLDPAAREPHPYITYTYDAVYTMAFALNETYYQLKEKNNSNIKLEDFEYFKNDTKIISELLTDNLNRTNFPGISGQVVFDKDGTRVSKNAIYQLRENEEGELRLELLAIHDPYPDFNGTNELNVSYEFNYTIEPEFEGGTVPKDRSTPIPKFIEQPLIYFFDVVIIISLIIALGLFVFNLVTFTKPLIRDSAPLINLVIIGGCIIMLATSFLLGIDSQTPDILGQDQVMEKKERYTIICNVRLWFFTVGFSLSFGALFSKTWQVYRVYTNQTLKKQPVQLWRFFLIIGIFLLVDLAYLSFWSGAAEHRLRWSAAEQNENGQVFEYERCDCQYFGYLIGALYVYKGLLVVFGLFLAYESRNVKYLKINDSRFVSIAMYIVVIVIGIGAPLSLVLALHNFVDAAYALSVTMIVASSMACLLIIHIPKFVYMAKGKETMIQENMKEEITESSGLQLGTALDNSGVKAAEAEVANLRAKDKETDIELQELQSGGIEVTIKPRNGSDNDSGVLVTGDETETFSSENDGNTCTPSDGSSPPGTTL